MHNHLRSIQIMSMRFIAVFVLALAGASMAGAQAGDHSHDAHHDHHDHSASAQMEPLQRPADGGKWATDEPLRQGMGELNEAFGQHHRAFEDGEFDSRDRKSTRLNSSHVAISYAVS